MVAVFVEHILCYICGRACSRGGLWRRKQYIRTRHVKLLVRLCARLRQRALMQQAAAHRGGRWHSFVGGVRQK